jgi:hypothetical protein
MSVAEALPIITSPGIAEDLSWMEARLEADAVALAGLAKMVEADAPERLVVVRPDELATELDIGTIHRDDLPPINISRHLGRYKTGWEAKGHIVYEGNDLQPRDLVIVTPSVSPYTLAAHTAQAFVNHPYLNRVARNDERLRELLDRWVVFGGISLAALVGLGGGIADFEGVPYLEWTKPVGLGLFVLGAATVAYTHNAAPRRVPFPELSGTKTPIYPVDADTGRLILGREL